MNFNSESIRDPLLDYQTKSPNTRKETFNSRSQMINAGLDPEATYYDLDGRIIYEPSSIIFIR